MKRTLFFLISFFVFISVYGQRQEKMYWSIGLKGGLGNSLLLNGNIFKDRNIMPNYFTPGWCYGGKMGLNFTSYIGIAAEVLSSGFGQSYKVSVVDTINKKLKYDKNIKLRSLDVPFLVRFTSKDKGIIELGVKYTMLKKATETNSTGDTSIKFPNEGNVMSKFRKDYMSLLFGVGGFFVKNPSFDISMTLRGSYAFVDIVTDANKYPYDGNYPTNPASVMKDKTKPFSLQLVLEVHYYVGYYATATCGRRKAFLFF